MIISYLRSSSYNNWSFCEMQYYLTYGLGWSFPACQKAEMGTIVHKALECLANINKISQTKKKFTFKDDCIGDIKVDSNWMKMEFLSDAEVDFVNKSRKAKSIYKHKCDIEYGHCREGVDLVEEIFDRVFDYYVSRSTHKWTKANRKHCHNWTWMPLDYKGGMFDPRKIDILDVEQKFDIEIDREWAKYDYELPNGERLTGKLAIKGTIDLITGDDDIVEIVDWKTGQRLDWNTGEVKTYAKLKKDPQLMLYYYAAKHLYPNAKQVILSIYYVRDGGPYTICFDDRHIDEMESLLEKRFKEIVACQTPKMLHPEQRGWKCEKLCPFFKNKFDESDRDNMCITAHRHVELHGLDATTKTYMHKDHKVDHYEAPG